MDKIQLLNDAERIIKHYQRKIVTLNAIEPGYIYEFKSGGHSSTTRRYGTNTETYLGRVHSFSNNTIRFELFACKEHRWKEKEILDSFDYFMSDIKKVDSRDLALYVTWPWKSPEFGKLLNGTSRIRLKKFEGD
jgi:hypothetical protein